MNKWTQRMIFKYFTGIILISIGTGCAQETIESDSEFLTNLVEIVAENHISPKELDDTFSVKVFNSFLLKMDPDKKIFTSKEISQLSSSEKLLDDEFKNGTTIFFDRTILMYTNAIIRSENIVNEFLNKEIDIFKEEYIESNVDKITFPKNKEALQYRLKLIVKKQFLDELLFAEITKPSLTIKEYKTIALKRTKVFFRDYFYQLSNQSRKLLFELYVNEYLSNNDYQSNYFSQEKKTIWDSKYRRNYVGVGLYMESRMTYPAWIQAVIKKVLYNGPAYSTNKINEGDILLKVSNEDNELIDIAGYPLKKVIDLLKGKSESIINIVVKKATKKIEVSIKRGQVPMSKAMSFILTAENKNLKIGYIYLPRFYIGEESAVFHILESIEFLKENDVEGIIIDLRNNKGGSAREAIEIMSYFLNGEDVMQAKYKNEDYSIFKDQDIEAQYSGKMVVMVNEKSGSASELFSGTMQDYKRAIIVGNQTFGKGTIQHFSEV